MARFGPGVSALRLIASLRGKTRPLPRRTSANRARMRRRGIPLLAPHPASPRPPRTVFESFPCARSSPPLRHPDPRSGGVFVRHVLRRRWRIALDRKAERRGGVSETNPDKHGSWTSSATNDFRRGECLVTACWRDALPCAIPDCRDRTPAPKRRRATSSASRDFQLCHIVKILV